MFRYLRFLLLAALMLLCLALPRSARAQDGGSAGAVQLSAGKLPLALTGDWRYHAGDNPAWAAREFNDSGWKQSLSLFATGAGSPDAIPFEGVGWFRMRIAADSSLLKRPLAASVMVHSA